MLTLKSAAGENEVGTFADAAESSFFFFFSLSHSSGQRRRHGCQAFAK
jgi:hypothetical protein